MTRPKPSQVTGDRIDAYCCLCGRLILRANGRITRIILDGHLPRLRMHLRATHGSAVIIGPDVRDVLRHVQLKARGVNATPHSNWDTTRGQRRP